MTEKDLFQLQAEETESMDLQEILRKYLRYWYWFAIGVVLCLLAAFLYLRYATPQYSIKGTLLIKDDEKGPSFSGSDMFKDLDIFQTSKNLDNEMEILRSRSLMQRVLKELSLQTSYLVKGNIRDVEVYGKNAPVKVFISRLDSAAYDMVLTLRAKGNHYELEQEDEEGNVQVSSHQFGQEIKKPYGTFTIVGNAMAVDEKEIMIRFHDIRKLADDYNEKLNVQPVNKDATVLSISLTDPVPQKGVDIIHKLIELYNKEAIEDKNQIAGNTIEFIDERLRNLTVELADVEKDVEQYKRRNELTDVSSEAQLYLERASEYNKQLAEFEIQIDVLNSIENYLKNQENEYELVPSSLSIQDPTLLGLITKFNELQLERNRMLRTTQPGNPIVVNINDQLENLRYNILENLKNIRRGQQITRQNLQATSQRFESRIQKVPMIERELLEINRQQAIKQELYLFLLTKREESALSLASTISDSRVIDPPVADEEPISPKKWIILLMAIMSGLLLPLALIFLKELLNNKVNERKDVERATATPILGEVVHSDNKEPLVVSQNNHSAIAEIFRLIRTNLQFSTLGKENKVILVTSSRSGEGKTFFSINLGATLALSGKKVVILSFDLRKPKLMQDLNLSNNMGITNYLISDDFSVEALVKPVPSVPGLHAIGSGPIPPNPAELMMGSKVAQLISELRKRYDYILLDSPPVGQVADAFTLAPYVDSTVYIVRYNYTFREQLAIIEDIYKNKKLNHPMVIMNDAKKKNGYGYGYGYGYGDESHVNGKKNKKTRRTITR